MAVSSGIYSLAGVLVGGGVTWLTQWGLAARTERQNAIVAKRQVWAELRAIKRVVDILVKRAELSAPLAEQLSTTQWTAHSDHLAHQLSANEWDDIATSYDLIGYIALLAKERSDFGKTAERAQRAIDNSMKILR